MANYGPYAWYVSSASWTAATQYAAAAWTVGNLIRQSNALGVAAGNERVFVCTVAGTTTTAAGSETLTITAGAASSGNGGSVTFCECTGQPAVNGDDAALAANQANTSASATTGATVLTFTAVPTNTAVGKLVLDKTTAGVVPAKTTIVAFTATTITLSNALTGTVNSGDTICVSNCPQWIDEKSTAVTVGLIVQDKTGAHLFMVTTAGTTGASEPAGAGWTSPTLGGTVTDNTVTWTYIGATGSFSAWAAPHARLANSVASGWAIASANANFFLGDNHAETQSTALSALIPAATVSAILCMDHTVAAPGPSNLKTGASITTTGTSNLTINMAVTTTSIYLNGISLSCGTGSGNVTLTLGSAYSTNRFDNCSIAIGSTGATCSISAAGSLLFNNTTATGGGASYFIIGGSLSWYNTVSPLQGTFASPWYSMTLSTGAFAVFDSCDLSNMSSPTLFSGSSSNLIVTYKNCKMPASYTLTNPGNFSSPNCPRCDVIRCDNGTATSDNRRCVGSGAFATNIQIVRTGGAVDNGTAVSWQISTTARCNFAGYFEALPVYSNNTLIGATRNVTMYGKVDPRVMTVLPTNSQVWFDVQYEGNSGSVLGVFDFGGQITPVSGSVNLTADTSTWTSGMTYTGHNPGPRQNSYAYNVGDIMYPAGNAALPFVCTATTGNSAASEPAGYAAALDGGTVTDGSCTFKGMVRFKYSLALSSPQPQFTGYLCAFPRVALASVAASTGIYLDPNIVQS